MTVLRSAALAIWEFAIGDDWRTALGVCVALGAVAILSGLGVASWWLMPVAVAGLLWASLRRFTKARHLD